MTTATITALRHPIREFFAAPFRSRPRNQLDRRALSAHLQRDLGFLDGHATPGSIR